MTEGAGTTSTTSHPGTSNAPGWPEPVRRYTGVLRQPQTYRNVAYLALAFPLGLAYFVALVALLATSGGLTVTLVGLPLLVATMFGWCVVAEFERVLANELLHARIGPLGFGREQGLAWVWPRIRARLANRMTWRALAFLFLRFPQGIAALVVLSFALSFPVWLIGMPLLAEIGSSDSAGVDFIAWRIDHWYEGLLLAPVGIALIPAAFHLTNGSAALCREMARAFLGGGTADASGSEAAIERGAVAAVQWQGLHLGRPADAAEARSQALQLKVFGAHLLVFASIAVIFAVVNGLTTPDNWWSLFVVWGFAFPLALHAGYLVRGLFGAHAGLFLVTNIGFFVIDAVYNDTTWFFWVLLGWTPLLVLHAVVDQRLRTGRQSQPVPVPTPGADHVRLRPAPELPEAAALQSEPGPPLQAISIDVEMRRVTVDGDRVELTPKEFELLALLARNPGRPFSRDELLDRIWRNDYEVTDRTVDTHVQRLRKKLGGHAEVIETVWGIGYRFQEE